MGKGRGRGSGKGPGNPEHVGPPEGATGSGDDAGLVSKQGTEMVAAGVNPEGPKTVKVDRKPKGKSSHKVTVSKDGDRKMSLRMGSGNPVSDVSRRQGKDKSGKNANKKRPTKGKTVVNQFDDHSVSTGSQGEPGKEAEVNPAEGMAESMEAEVNPDEGMADPMDMEIEEEVSRAFRNIPYNMKKK